MHAASTFSWTQRITLSRGRGERHSCDARGIPRAGSAHTILNKSLVVSALCALCIASPSQAQSQRQPAGRTRQQSVDHSRTTTDLQLGVTDFDRFDPPVRLTPRSVAESTDAEEKPGRSTAPIGTVIFATALLAGAIWLLGRIIRRSGYAPGRTMPVDVLEVLGSRAIDRNQVIHLIRCGSRILVVGSSSEGLRTLSEISDPVEADLLAGACRHHRSATGNSSWLPRVFRAESDSELPATAAVPTAEHVVRVQDVHV